MGKLTLAVLGVAGRAFCSKFSEGRIKSCLGPMESAAGLAKAGAYLTPRLLDAS